MTIDKDKAVEAQERILDLVSNYIGYEQKQYNEADSWSLSAAITADQLRELIEDRDRYKADAERYQWLIDQRRWYYNKTPTPGISLKWENLIQGNSNWIGDAIDTQRGVK